MHSDGIARVNLTLIAKRQDIGASRYWLEQ